MVNLSLTQIQDFKRDGFLVIHGMYNHKEMTRLSGWIDEITSQKPEIGKHMVYFEDSLQKKGEKILSRIEKFTDYRKTKRIRLR